ncbi:MAG: TolC family protein [Bdellovibrio sp.]|nr:TolC family protein [Bdellovibrio sp.]
MKPNYRILILTFLLSMIAEAETVEITFEALPNLLESRNPKVEASRALTEAAFSRTGYLGRSFLPSLTLLASQETFKIGQTTGRTQPMYGAELNMNVFNSGRDLIESQLRTLSAERKSVEHLRITSEELQKVRNLFWETLYIQEKIKLLDSTMKVNQKNLSTAVRRVRSGVATESDRVEFEMKAVDLNRDLSESQLKLVEYKNQIAVLLNLSENAEIKLPEIISHEHDLENLGLHSEKDHEYLYKENELQSEASALASKSINRSWLPRLDAFAGYHQYNQRDKDPVNESDRTESVLGVKVSISLAHGWEGARESSALLKESQAFKKIADMQKKETEIHLKNEIAMLNLLHGQVHEAEENIIRAEKYYKLTQSEYIRGVKNSPDVLSASEKIYEMQNKKIEIIRDFQVAKAHVLSKLGK